MNSRSWALFNMRKNGNKEYTKSELKLVDEIVTNCFSDDILPKELESIIVLQNQLRSLKPVLDGDELVHPTNPPPRIDISIPELKIAIRVNGLIHTHKTQRLKDEDQKLVLEGNGWTVIDVNFDDREDLWN